MKFKIYKDAKGEWRWRLLSRNGRILADSGEGYTRLGKCKNAVRRIIIGVQSAQMSYL